MFGSAILDTAIGMVFVFFIVSNICSSAFTFIAQWKQLKGKLLQRGLLYLLGEETRTKLMQHPLIRDISLKSKNRGFGIQTSLQMPLQENLLPAWIPSNVFVEALSDIILDAAEDQIMREISHRILSSADMERGRLTIENTLRSILEQTEENAVKTVDNLLAQLSQRFGHIDDTERQEILALVRQLFRYKENIVDYLRSGLEVLNLPEKARLLFSHHLTLFTRQSRIGKRIEDAEMVLQSVKDRIESWYNNATNSLTPIYKRWSQFYIGGVAVIVTLLFNINSLAIAQTLWESPTIRDSIVERASTAPAPTETGATEQQTPVEIYDEQLEALNIPVGWTKKELDNISLGFLGYVEEDGRADYSLWNRLIGWLITTIAALLGAPFWFGVLGRIMNMRQPAPKEEAKG